MFLSFSSPPKLNKILFTELGGALFHRGVEHVLKPDVDAWSFLPFSYTYMILKEDEQI